MTTPDQHLSNKSVSQPSEANIDWANIIKQWKASGLSQARYCKANDIHYNQCVYQNAKLSARTKASSKLLRVKITHHEAAPAALNNFVLHYADGFENIYTC